MGKLSGLDQLRVSREQREAPVRAPLVEALNYKDATLRMVRDDYRQLSKAVTAGLGQRVAERMKDMLAMKYARQLQHLLGQLRLGGPPVRVSVDPLDLIHSPRSHLSVILAQALEKIEKETFAMGTERVMVSGTRRTLRIVVPEFTVDLVVED